MSEKILEVENLKKYYGNVKAVNDVSFWIKKGQVYSILGPNGAGKTTTIEIIEGLRVKDSGTIRIFGKTVESIDREQKERIGVQLQETNFFPHLTVEETIELFRSFFARSLPGEKVLGIAMLEEKKRSYVEKLSGGQKQRLALGLALVNDPEIVFLDEPTTGMDPQARRSVWETIKQFKAEGKTIILTTHYMEEAEELSDYILIMDHGKIIKEGTSSELISGLDMQSMVEFEVSGPHPVEALQKSRKLDAKAIGNGRFAAETTDFMQTLTVLSDLAQKNDFQLKNVVVRQPNLEDVFLHLTGRTLRD